MSERIEKLIMLFGSEEAKAANYRNLCQDAADLDFPRENQITRREAPGTERTDEIVDTTGVMASMEMASGLSQNLVPPGQKFFTLLTPDESVNKIEDVRRFLNSLTDITHEALFTSNFLLQLNETLRSLAVFGTGCLFSTFDLGLNFMDYDIANYVIMENSRRRVDAIFVKFCYTATQAFEKWGNNAGESVLRALENIKTQGQLFEFLHYVAPRDFPKSSLTDNLNMPFESIYISLKDKVSVEEGGFEDFPYHVVRWSKSSNEIWGRGQGIFSLPDVRMLQWMKAGLIECANKHNDPALLVNEAFEGEVRVGPGGINYVNDITNSIRAIKEAQGNFPITKDMLEMQQEVVKKDFFNDVFVRLGNLTGDRRTTLEIRELIAEGLQRLGPPIGRINEELFTPLINRSAFLLLNNGRVPFPIPPELDGQNLKIEYIGRLALELKSHQARAAQQWLTDIGELVQIFPEARDIVNVDSAVKRRGETLGVHIDDINTDEVIAAKRQARQEAIQQQQALEMAQAAGKTYKDASGAAEAGSPAGELMEAVSG